MDVSRGDTYYGRVGENTFYGYEINGSEVLGNVVLLVVVVVAFVCRGGGAASGERVEAIHLSK